MFLIKNYCPFTVSLRTDNLLLYADDIPFYKPSNTPPFSISYSDIDEFNTPKTHNFTA